MKDKTNQCFSTLIVTLAGWCTVKYGHLNISGLIFVEFVNLIIQIKTHKGLIIGKEIPFKVTVLDELAVKDGLLAVEVDSK